MGVRKRNGIMPFLVYLRTPGAIIPMGAMLNRNTPGLLGGNGAAYIYAPRCDLSDGCGTE